MENIVEEPHCAYIHHSYLSPHQTAKLGGKLASPTLGAGSNANMPKSFRFRGPTLKEQFPFNVPPTSGGGKMARHKSSPASAVPLVTRENNAIDVIVEMEEEVD